MNYIELFGFAGSGKTTIAAELSAQKDVMASVNKFDISTWNVLPSPSRVIPEPVRSKLGRAYWRAHAEPRLFTEFARDHPTFLSNTWSYVRAQHADDGIRREKQRRLRETMATYQWGKRATADEDMFILDEGFFHKIAVSAKATGTFPSDAWLRLVPPPRLIVHLDPPIDVLRSRRIQDHRDSIYHRAELEDILSGRTEFMTRAEQVGFPVVRIANVESPASVVDRIMTEYLSISGVSREEPPPEPDLPTA